jgi:hypothetical protein
MLPILGGRTAAVLVSLALALMTAPAVVPAAASAAAPSQTHA